MALIEVELTRVMLVETSDQQVVVLQEKGGKERNFPIFIGVFEAVAIHRSLRNEESPRPMTHDLIVNIIESLGGTVDKVIVRDLVDSTFLGSIFVAMPEKIVEIDSRPSDALAVAVRTGCPLFVDEKVFDSMSK